MSEDLRQLRAVLRQAIGASRLSGRQIETAVGLGACAAEAGEGVPPSPALPAAVITGECEASQPSRNEEPTSASLADDSGQRRSQLRLSSIPSAGSVA